MEEPQRFRETMADLDEVGGGRGRRRSWILTGALLLLALLVGVALGIYAVPAGILPGDPDHEAALAAANQRLSSVEDILNDEVILELSIDQAISRANAESEDVDMALARMLPARVYTIRSDSLGTCADYVGFDIEGTLRSFRLAEPYAC